MVISLAIRKPLNCSSESNNHVMKVNNMDKKISLLLCLCSVWMRPCLLYLYLASDEYILYSVYMGGVYVYEVTAIMGGKMVYFIVHTDTLVYFCEGLYKQNITPRTFISVSMTIAYTSKQSRDVLIIL